MLWDALFYKVVVIIWFKMNQYPYRHNYLEINNLYLKAIQQTIISLLDLKNVHTSYISKCNTSQQL